MIESLHDASALAHLARHPNPMALEAPSLSRTQAQAAVPRLSCRRRRLPGHAVVARCGLARQARTARWAAPVAGARRPLPRRPHCPVRAQRGTGSKVAAGAGEEEQLRRWAPGTAAAAAGMRKLQRQAALLRCWAAARCRTRRPRTHSRTAARRWRPRWATRGRRVRRGTPALAVQLVARGPLRTGRAATRPAPTPTGLTAAAAGLPRPRHRLILARRRCRPNHRHRLPRRLAAWPAAAALPAARPRWGASVLRSRMAPCRSAVTGSH